MNRDQPVFAQLLRFLPRSHCADENNKNGINAHSGGIKSPPCRYILNRLIQLTLKANCNLISNDRQLTGGREPGPVIPGLPARAEPGIQGLLELFSGFRVPLRGPGMTG